MTGNSQILALFPGQGSQQVGMGKDLYNEFPVAKEIFEIADEVLGFSLSRICFEGPEEKLKQTAITQPAILTVSCIAWEIFQSQHTSPANIVAAAGHSLGEYSALVAAGALLFKDAVTLVHKRGTYMQEAVPQGKGKMLAVIGLEKEQLEPYFSKLSSGIVEMANINSPTQIVVAGEAQGIDELKEHLEGVKAIELEVSAPFHCSLMQPAAKKLALDLKNISIQPACFPVYSNFLASPVTDPDTIREMLISQVCGSVRWAELVQNVLNDTGANSAIEFGTGRVLSSLMKKIDRKFPTKQFGTGENIRQSTQNNT